MDITVSPTKLTFTSAVYVWSILPSYLFFHQRKCHENYCSGSWMPIAEALRHWQDKHPFTTLSYSLTFHFYWKSLQLFYLPNPIYHKQHSNWHSSDVWFNCIQKPEPVAPLPLVQGSCHESFLLILSLSRLQLQWHTHEICASLPLHAKWGQQHLILPRSRVVLQGLLWCPWILSVSSKACTFPMGEAPRGTSCPTAMVGWGPPGVPTPSSSTWVRGASRPADGGQVRRQHHREVKLEVSMWSGWVGPSLSWRPASSSSAHKKGASPPGWA